MKLKIFLLLCCSFCSIAFAQNENVETQNVATPHLGQSVSEQLISLSRNEKVNILADATFFSAVPKELPLQEEGVVKKLLKLGYLNRLSMRTIDDHTFLLWSEPDTTAVVKSLIDDSLKATELNTPIPFAFMPSNVDDQKAGVKLATYLEQKRAWDGQSTNFTAEFALSELPDEDADILATLINANLLKSNASRQRLWPLETAWISDELWQKARIGYFRTPDNESVLAIHSSDGQQDYDTEVNNLVSFPSTKWQPTPSTSIVNNDVAGEAIEKLTTTKLRNETPLAAPVTFEVSDVPLKLVLAEMQKSGVNFETPPGLLSDKRVTASVTNMPLHDVMSALTGLYGIAWLKSADNTYVALLGLSPVQVDALQIGEFQYFRYWQEPLRRPEFPEGLDLPPLKNLKTELAKAGIEEKQLLEPKGVEFSALPEDLRNLVRQNVERQMTPQFIDQYKNAFIDTVVDVDKSAISIQVKPSLNTIREVGVPAVNTAPTLNAFIVADGKEIGSIGIYNRQMREAVVARINRLRGPQKS